MGLGGVDGDANRDEGRARLLDGNGWIDLPFWGREDAQDFRHRSRAQRLCLARRLPGRAAGAGLSPDDFEVIAVDNLSSDDSMAVARRRRGVRLLSEKRPGAYAARNQGIGAASGELVAFIDADCVPCPDWLGRLQSAMAEAPGTVVVIGRDIPTGPSLAIRLLGLYDHAKEEFVLSSDDPTLYYGHTKLHAGTPRRVRGTGPFRSPAAWGRCDFRAACAATLRY